MPDRSVLIQSLIRSPNRLAIRNSSKDYFCIFHRTNMSVISTLLLDTTLMAVLSFVAGLPAFWILSKSQSALPYLVQLTSGLLLSTCINIVLPEALSNLSQDQLESPSLGPQILLGFILLYSIDVFSASLSDTTSADVSNISMENASFDLDVQDGPMPLDHATHKLSHYLHSVVLNSTTLGLLLHCLTDGVILTTSVLSENSHPVNSNAFLIILAIFLHKLPAAFSLTSILLNQKLHPKIVLFHLFLFAMSAPIGAWLTLIIIKLFNSTDNELSNSFIMLFSTGAFLYVSFHTFVSSHKSTGHSCNSTASNWNFLVTIIGMLLPILLTFLHDD